MCIVIGICSGWVIGGSGNSLRKVKCQKKICFENLVLKPISSSSFLLQSLMSRCTYDEYFDPLHIF